jgi:glutamyl endopeptidase
MKPEGHTSMRSEDANGPTLMLEPYEPATPRRETRVEPVTGYRPLVLGQPSTPAPLESSGDDGGPVLDAWAGSFGVSATLEVVFGNDDRVLITEVDRNPWRQICALRIRTTTGKMYAGTAWFIGPKALATAGHCVYLHNEGGFAQTVEVIPGLNGSLRPYSSFFSTRLRAVDGWIRTKRPDCDYGVILLDDDAGNRLGWWNVRSERDELLTKTEANICGYPQDRDQATRQYFHARKLGDVSPGLLYYRIDTFGGQSGSPIWQNTGTERIAVGVHTAGGVTSNSGTRITTVVLDNLKQWRDQ